jgi:hypothetical protein
MDKTEKSAMEAIPELSKSVHSISMSLKIIAATFQKYVDNTIELQKKQESIMRAMTSEEDDESMREMLEKITGAISSDFLEEPDTE